MKNEYNFYYKISTYLFIFCCCKIQYFFKNFFSLIESGPVQNRTSVTWTVRLVYIRTIGA